MAADDFFGDFNFAPKPPTTLSTLSPSYPPDSFGDDDGDDDWGDFVATRSDQINGGESPAVTRTDPAPRWVKPSGALPLSLFGDDEEEKSSASEPGFSYGEPISFGGEKEKKVSSLNGGVVTIRDLIVDLYGPSEKIEPRDQEESESDANSNPNLNANSSSSWNQNGFGFGIHDADSSSSKLDLVGPSSGLVQQNENFDDDDNEDYGWEFQGADVGKQIEAPGPKVEIGSVKDGEIQVDDGGRVSIEEPKPATQLQNGSHDRVENSTQSNNTSSGDGDWNLGFEFDPILVNKNDNLWDSYSGSKNESDTQLGSDFSFVNKAKSNDNFWQFEDSFSGAQAEPEPESAKVSVPAELGVKIVNGDVPHEPTDASKGSLNGPKEWDFELNFNPNLAIEASTIADVTFESKTIETGKGASSSVGDKHDNSEDSVWAFRDAFSDSGLKDEGQSTVMPDPFAISIPPGSEVPNQRNETSLGSQREALPLSLFGDEELETNDSHVNQDVSTQTFTSNSKPVSNLSINDLISSLYGQAEQNTSANDEPVAIENEPSSITRAMESGLVYPEDDFDDDSWEFKDASWDGKAQNQTFATSLEDSPTKSSLKLQLDDLATSLEDSPTKSSLKLQLDDFIDFYSKLKGESCYIALSHFETLKKTQSSIFEGLGEENLKLYDQLCHDNLISEFHLVNLSDRNSTVNELLKVLREPKFRALESKYHLSDQLLLAKKDLGSAIELSKQVTSTLRILKLGSSEEQSSYVTAWSKILSVCAQQLKLGASIWKKALQKNVSGKILSEPQGRQYITALGEIYRVVQVIGASVKLYKPWISLDSEGPVCVHALLNECSGLWSTSGLDAALERLSESGSETDRAVIELRDSIKYIHSLDSLSLYDHVFSGRQPLCRLSMLTPEVLPGMKTVLWDRDHYVLKLANFWGNLISSNPPELPCLSIS